MVPRDSPYIPLALIYVGRATQFVVSGFPTLSILGSPLRILGPPLSILGPELLKGVITETTDYTARQPLAQPQSG